MTTEKERISIVAGFTPYHAYVSSFIIENLTGKVFCFFSKDWPRTRQAYIRLGNARAAHKLISSVLSLAHLSFIFHSATYKRIPIDIYLPHPGHIFTNYLFFSKNANKRVFIYEDGLLNYLDTSFKNKFVTPAKKALSCLLALPYHDYPGHTAGYDAGKYDGAFLSRPEHAVRKNALGTINKLESVAEIIKPIPQRILFLDQSTEGYLTTELRNSRVSHMLKLFPTADFQYFYKPHHDHDSPLRRSMQAIPSNLINIAAELIIKEIRPSLVISFFSSALINIKNKHPEIDCISLAADYIPISIDGKPELISSLFKAFGVRSI